MQNWNNLNLSCQLNIVITACSYWTMYCIIIYAGWRHSTCLYRIETVQYLGLKCAVSESAQYRVESAQYRGRYCALSRIFFSKMLFWPKTHFDKLQVIDFVYLFVFVLFLQISRKKLDSLCLHQVRHIIIGLLKLSRNMAFVQYRGGAPKVAPPRYWTHAIFLDTTSITHNYTNLGLGVLLSPSDKTR